MEFRTWYDKYSTDKTKMWNYIKYFLKLMFGFMIIIALDVMLKVADSIVGNWWFYLTLIFYNGYCYLEFRLTDKQD